MAKNMIIQVLIDGVTYEAMVKTTGEMVWLTDTVTVSEKIAEIIAVLNKKATTAYVDEKISSIGTPEDGDPCIQEPDQSAFSVQHALLHERHGPHPR